MKKFAILVEISGSGDVDLGRSLLLQCVVNAFPVFGQPGRLRLPVDVEWLHNGLILYSPRSSLATNSPFSDRFSVSRKFFHNHIISTLLVNQAKLSDSGIYTCRTKQHLAEIRVEVLLPTEDSELGAPLEYQSEYESSYDRVEEFKLINENQNQIGQEESKNSNVEQYQNPEWVSRGGNLVVQQENKQSLPPRVVTGLQISTVPSTGAQCRPTNYILFLLLFSSFAYALLV